MAKNKGQKSKKSVPRKLSGVKKAKTKPVTTNLKKLNFQNKSKTEKADAAFKDLQTAITTPVTKPPETSKEPKKSELPDVKPAPDINETAEDLSKL